MPYVLGVFKLKDYESWKAGFTAEASAAWRRKDGGGACRIFRSAEDPQTALVLAEWDSLEHARQHAQSEALRKIHAEALRAAPEVYLLDLDEELPG